MRHMTLFLKYLNALALAALMRATLEMDAAARLSVGILPNIDALIRTLHQAVDRTGHLADTHQKMALLRQLGVILWHLVKIVATLPVLQLLRLLAFVTGHQPPAAPAAPKAPAQDPGPEARTFLHTHVIPIVVFTPMAALCVLVGGEAAPYVAAAWRWVAGVVPAAFGG
jgi:hypothetical protein